jgi:flagellar biosynthetic protein FliQ
MDHMLWTAMAIGGPVLLATLGVGLLISILQVATQVQEITLSYVPKMLVAVFVLIALGPWMLAQLTEFARSLYLLIPSLAH